MAGGIAVAETPEASPASGPCLHGGLGARTAGLASIPQDGGGEMGLGDDDIAERLRQAIARRDALRPGTAAHWRASCEARALMKRFVAVAAPVPVTPRPDAVESAQA